MKELHQKYLEKLSVILQICDKFSISSKLCEEIKQDIDDISSFKVTVPIVGGFSTGKSSLLNAVLGADLLSTNVTAETAVPTEITYGQDSVIFVKNDGVIVDGNFLDLKDATKSLNTKLVKVSVYNDFLKSIPDVKLVDMPGFDSGIEVHNRAINDYMPCSLAYIITLSADEGALKASVLNLLSELKLNDMPVYFVITKADQIPPSEIDEVVSSNLSLIRTKMNNPNIKCTITSSSDDIIDDFKLVLNEIQKNSDSIFEKRYHQRMEYYVKSVSSYINKLLSTPNTTILQNQEEKKRLEEKIAELRTEISTQKDAFSVTADRCIEDIYVLVDSELKQNSSTFEDILVQGGSIQEKANYIVRSAITTGIRQKLAPKLNEYISNVADIAEIDDISIVENTLIDSTLRDDNEKTRQALQASVPAVTTAAAMLIAEILGGPVALAITGIAGALLSGAINKMSRDREAEQLRAAAHSQVNSHISQILSSVRSQISLIINDLCVRVNAEIENKLNMQIELHKTELNEQEKLLQQSEEEQTIRMNEYSSALSSVQTLI